MTTISVFISVTGFSISLLRIKFREKREDGVGRFSV